MTRSKHLTVQGLDKLNFLVGRAYCSDQEQDSMCEHRDGSEHAITYSKQAPIIIVSTGATAVRLSLTVRLTPNCPVDDGPEAALEFQPKAHSVHVCCFTGPGAQCVRHRVRVPPGVQRFACVLRGLQKTFNGLRSAREGEPYQQLIHQCELAAQLVWDMLTAEVRLGTIHAESEAIAALRAPKAAVGAYSQSTGAAAWCLDLLGISYSSVPEDQGRNSHLRHGCSA